MVKSFSQDGYSPMSNNPSNSYVLRGRGMSAAASNEALEEAMRPSGWICANITLPLYLITSLVLNLPGRHK